MDVSGIDHRKKRDRGILLALSFPCLLGIACWAVELINAMSSPSYQERINVPLFAIYAASVVAAVGGSIVAFRAPRAADVRGSLILFLFTLLLDAAALVWGLHRHLFI